MLRGRTPVLPGKAVASSMIAPALLAWWLWPVSRATRVGLQSAVVWKRLYRRPLFASFSSVGMLMGPPKALLWPKPMSSIKTMTTLGAPLGALTSNRGGALALRASSSVITGVRGSGIGRIVRSRAGPCPAAGAAVAAASSAASPRLSVYEVTLRSIEVLLKGDPVDRAGEASLRADTKPTAARASRR